MHQERSYVIAISPASLHSKAAPLDAMYYGADSDGLSFRSFGNIVLIGDKGHRTGKTPPDETRHYDLLIKKAEEYWPDCQLLAKWSAQDCIPLDGIPYIGRFSASKPSWYVATGFKKWGMTTSMAAAQILTGLICNKSVSYKGIAYDSVFSPKRPLTKKAVQSFC